jgi:GTP cyclohydrolase I
VVNAYSRRLQVQERLTNQIVDCINQVLDPIGAAVIVTAEHFCMATRGICKPGIKTTTSALRGVFKTEHEARSELFQLIAQATK